MLDYAGPLREFLERGEDPWGNGSFDREACPQVSDLEIGFLACVYNHVQFLVNGYSAMFGCWYGVAIPEFVACLTFLECKNSAKQVVESVNSVFPNGFPRGCDERHSTAEEHFEMLKETNDRFEAFLIEEEVERHIESMAKHLCHKLNIQPVWREQTLPEPYDWKRPKFRLEDFQILAVVD